jgi:hypothetical protein
MYTAHMGAKSLAPSAHTFIVPSLGHTVRGNLKPIGKSGKYLFPVRQLSLKFRGSFMAGVKRYLSDRHMLSGYMPMIRQAWNKPWVVYCEPSLFPL